MKGTKYGYAPSRSIDQSIARNSLFCTGLEARQAAGSLIKLKEDFFTSITSSGEDRRHAG
jgi:hypothetical protein